MKLKGNRTNKTRVKSCKIMSVFNKTDFLDIRRADRQDLHFIIGIAKTGSCKTITKWKKEF